MALTEEQRQRIAANRAEALRRQAAVRNAQQSRPSTSLAPPRPSTSFAPQRPTAPAPAPQPRQPTTTFQRPLNFNAPRQQYSAGRFGNPSSSYRPRFNNYRYQRPGYYQRNAFPRPQQQQPQNELFPMNPPQDVNKKKTSNTVSLTLYNSERFKLEMKPFMNCVSKFAQGFPDGNYDASKKCWHFPWSRYHEMKDQLNDIKEIEFNIVELLPSVVEYFQNKKPFEDVNDDKLANLKVTMWKTLYPYQQEGILHGIRNGGRLLIADEMGLGKSIQALGLSFYYRQEWPLLIVTPSSVKGSWQEQIEKFLPRMCLITLVEKTNDKLPHDRSIRSVVIISYDMMVRKVEELCQAKFYVVIFDECHMLKEEKAKRTKVATRLANAAMRVVMLSGTPAISRPAELFTQIRMITPKLFPNFIEFATTYCDGKDTINGFIARGATRTDELTTILQQAIMIRRTKENIVLPLKERKLHYLEKSEIDTEMKSLKEAKEQLNAKSKGGKVKSKEQHESLMEYYRTTAQVKAGAVSAYLKKEYVDPGITRKMLVFAHHKIVLDTIQQMLISSEVCHIRIDGTTAERTALVEEFQTNDECMVALLSMTAAGVGITLTAASLVIFAELHWNPATLMQAEDRAHRVGQTRNVDVYYIMAPSTADDEMLKLIKNKMRILDSVELNTGNLENAKKSFETGAKKITTYFKKLGENNGESGDNDNDDVIVIDDDNEDGFYDDDFFVDKPSPEAKKRESAGENDAEIPAKRSK